MPTLEASCWRFCRLTSNTIDFSHKSQSTSGPITLSYSLQQAFHFLWWVNYRVFTDIKIRRLHSVNLQDPEKPLVLITSNQIIPLEKVSQDLLTLAEKKILLSSKIIEFHSHTFLSNSSNHTRHQKWIKHTTEYSTLPIPNKNQK